MRRLIHLAAGVAVLSLSSFALGQGPIVYPAKGQSPEQQNKDDGECYVWAKQNTGIDPAVAQTPTSPQQQQPGGERLRGATRGALGGAAIGAVTGDAGEGAAVGAIVGTMAGGRRERSRGAASKQEAQAQQQQQLDTYYRAYGACMEGRGYTVK